jgi:hypothetical protein
MNSKHSRHLYSCFATLYALLTAFTILPGCGSGGGQDREESILIRVGESTATVQEFQEAVKSGMAAASVLAGETDSLQSERYRTLNRLTEELIVLERARELKIRISDEELANAADDFRKDFPDDTFEQTLIENGISYLAWEKGLKRRLLMEKVIRTDVQEDLFPVPLPFDEEAAARMNSDLQIQFPLEEEDEAEIETEDTETLPGETPPENGAESVGETRELDTPENETEQVTAPTLPGNRAESEYRQWLSRLKKQYSIEINWELWEKTDQGNAGESLPRNS